MVTGVVLVATGVGCDESDASEDKHDEAMSKALDELSPQLQSASGHENAGTGGGPASQGLASSSEWRHKCSAPSRNSMAPVLRMTAVHLEIDALVFLCIRSWSLE